MRRIEVGLSLQTPAKSPAAIAESERQISEYRSGSAELFDKIPAPRFKPITRYTSWLLGQIAALLRSAEHFEPGALSTDVHDTALRHVPARPTGAARTKAEIGFVEVKEVTLIQ